MSGKETKNVGLALRVTNARLKRKVANPFVNPKRNMPTAKPLTWEFNLNKLIMLTLRSALIIEKKKVMADGQAKSTETGQQNQSVRKVKNIKFI